MFNFFANVLAGYVLIGVAIAFCWLVYGLVKNRGPVANLDLFMLGLTMLLVTITWGVLAAVYVYGLYYRVRYGDFRGKVEEDPLPHRRQHHPDREVDEHEEFPGI